VGFQYPRPERPYVGLQSFREEDSAFFFGRERDGRVILSNLLSQRLTILYGPSGVGKSSVLRAGVIPYLRAESPSCVLYFNKWQSHSFLEELKDGCENLLSTHPERNTHDVDSLISTLAGPSPFFLILDQFEEYLLYQSSNIEREVF
jgi:AAA+ ATPase superfamily predicted ATPase